MAQHHHHESDIFIKEAEGHQRRYHKIVELTHSTTKAAGVMLLGLLLRLSWQTLPFMNLSMNFGTPK